MPIYEKDTGAGIYGNAGLHGQAGLYSPGASAAEYLAESLDYFARAEALDTNALVLDLVDSYDSDFSAGTDGWGGYLVSTSGGNDAIGGRDDALAVVADTNTNVHVLRKPTSICKFGANISGTVEIFIPSTNTIVDSVRFNNVSYTTTGEWFTAPFAHTDSTNFNFLFLRSGESINFTGDGVEAIYVRNIRATIDDYATATETYTKTGIDAFIRALKGENPSTFTGVSAIGGDSFGTPPAASDCWSKMTEIYNLGPVAFGAITAKLKHAGTATLTNNNFVSGDHVPVGSGAGLKGDGSSKFLETSVGILSVNKNDFSFGAITSEVSGSPSAGGVIGPSYSATGNTDRLYINTGVLQVAAGNLFPPYASALGMMHLNLQGPNKFRFYKNGSLEVSSDLWNNDGFQFGTFRLFQGYGTFGNVRIMTGFLGNHMSATESARFAWCVNSLATYFGANTYVNP